MSSDVGVRSATLADVEGIQRVARETWHAAYDDILGPDAVDEQVDEWYADDVVASSVDSDETVYVVASAGGDVVGYASAGPADEGEATAQLHAIYVEPGRWGAGIGSRLLDAVSAHLRDCGFERMVIAVLADNEVGRDFYESHGFEAVGYETAELAGGEYRDALYAGPL